MRTQTLTECCYNCFAIGRISNKKCSKAQKGKGAKMQKEIFYEQRAFMA